MSSFLFLAGCGGSISTQIVNADSQVVFVGDSIFHRWDLLAYFPGKNYIDSGVEGECTDQILARLPQIISGKKVCTGFQTALNCVALPKPKFIVIYAGWNDVFQLVDPTVASANIQSMVKLCKQNGVTPIVTALYHFDPAFPHHTPNPFDAPVDAINAGIRSMATTENVQVIPLDQLFAGQQNYTVDDMHPNAMGYRNMAEEFNNFRPLVETSFAVNDVALWVLLNCNRHADCAWAA